MLEAVGDHYLISSESDFFNSCFSTNKKISNKRRFSDEQVKSLETMFESESKLEPRKKLELAKELGLQPRQVSIWFQNKRARWKSKQLERDYNVLQSNYDALSSRLESLKRENQSLVFQIKKLRELMEKDEEQVMARGTSGSDENSSSEGAMGVEVIEEYRGLCGQGDFGIDSDEGSSIKEEYIGIGLREEEIVKMEDTASLTSIDYWEGLEEGDNASYNHLWDFWD